MSQLSTDTFFNISLTSNRSATETICVTTTTIKQNYKTAIDILVTGKYRNNQYHVPETKFKNVSFLC